MFGAGTALRAKGYFPLVVTARKWDLDIINGCSYRGPSGHPAQAMIGLAGTDSPCFLKGQDYHTGTVRSTREVGLHS